MSPGGQISLAPRPAEVSRFNIWLDEKLAESSLDRSLAADLKLCLNEVLANLIAYGLNDIPDGSILVDVRLEPTGAVAVVADNGTYFDIKDYRPVNNRDLMYGEVGGFGVALIKERASRIDYRRSCGLNWLTIVCGAVKSDTGPQRT